MTNQKRTPPGVPTGGEYASNEHDEARPMMPGYTYHEHTTDWTGKPFEHMKVGESRGAIFAHEDKPLTVESFRFEDGTKVVTLIPGDKHADWDDWESRALFLAQTEHMRASVERVNNHRDWLRQRETPFYVVTLSRSVKDPLTHEYHERTLDVEIIDPRGIPGRIDGIVRAVESAREFEEYEDLEDFIWKSGKEPDDAHGDYNILQERRDDLHDFLGEEKYQEYVNGVTPGVRYETKEFTS